MPPRTLTEVHEEILCREIDELQKLAQQPLSTAQFEDIALAGFVDELQKHAESLGSLVQRARVAAAPAIGQQLPAAPKPA